MYIHVYIRMYICICILIECHEWFDRGKYEQERNSLVAICDQCSEYKTYPQYIFLGVHNPIGRMENRQTCPVPLKQTMISAESLRVCSDLKPVNWSFPSE